VRGEENPDTLICIDNMGSFLRAQGKYTEAEPYLREALEKFRRVLGEENVDTLTCIGNMGDFLSAQGRYTDAEPYYREMLEKCRRVRGEEHPDTAGAMSFLGLVLILQNTTEKAAEAEPLLRQCLAIRTAILPESDWRLARVRSLLGGALVVQGRALLASDHAGAMAKLTEAQPLLVEGYERMNPPPELTSFKTETLRRVVELFEVLNIAEPDQGHDAAGAQWKAKLDTLRQGSKP
jgi:tetratricopeptide (TPR) repeat protein